MDVICLDKKDNETEKKQTEYKASLPSFERGWRVFLGSFLLLIVSYTIYFVRYPIWGWTVEPIFAVLILSYFVVLVFALVLIKKDLKKSLFSVFSFHGSRLVLVGLGFAVLSQALWFGISLGLGGKVEFLPFPSLRGYELYTYYSLPVAFALYVTFATFGSFAEEAIYRGYVQTRISAKYGVIVGIFASTIFLSLQHIHVFQLPWIERFFQGQFISVFFGGIFGGYFFYKSKGDIWSIFAFHALGDIFSISLPIQVAAASPFTYLIATIIITTMLILILRFLPLRSIHASEKTKQ